MVFLPNFCTSEVLNVFFSAISLISIWSFDSQARWVNFVITECITKQVHKQAHQETEFRCSNPSGCTTLIQNHACGNNDAQ